MKIKSIHIENFRGLVDEFVEFNDSMTVLAGGNGGGKSSLLEAVSIMLSWLPVELSNYTSSPLRIKTSDITFGKKYSRLTMTLSSRRSKDIRLVLSKRRHSSKNCLFQ
jgi:predicted ATP-dependent endonuclease of OLD family